MDTAEKPAVDILDDRPDFVKKLDEIDVHNLSPEDEKFLYDSVQNFFMENFPVDKELVDKIPEKTVIVDHEKFTEAYLKLDPNTEEEDFPFGFYDVDLDKNFVDCDTAENASAIFSTIFHESLHYVSMNQGAGLRLVGSDFKVPESDDYLGDFSVDDVKYYGQKTEKVLVEGTTKILEQLSLEDMGINTDKDEGYNAEKQIMSEILNAVAPEYDQLKGAYFTKSLEDIRKIVERNLLPPEEREKYQDGEIPTGEFVKCLLNIGMAIDKMYYYYGQDDPDSYFGVLSEVHNAAQYYQKSKEKQENA